MPTLYEEARTVLRQAEFRPRKRLGQNFLVHDRVIDAIVRLADLNSSDEILEIGPGLGFLTRRLLNEGATVRAVEVDPFLVKRLRNSELAENPNFHLVEGDILKVPLADILPRAKIKLVGNLPYSISTPVLFHILDLREHFSSLVLMVQKEVADRIASAPGTKTYGTLSIWCQIHGHVVGKVQVSPEAFFPRPKVRSTVLKIELYPTARASQDEMPLLRGLVRAAFGQRRKTLGTVMVGWLKWHRDIVEKFLLGEGVDPKRRGETLGVEEFLCLARALKSSGLPLGAVAC